MKKFEVTTVEALEKQGIKLERIPDKPFEESIYFDNHIQSTAYIQGTIIEIFREWFLSFFQEGYFKHTYTKDSAAFGHFKSFMKNIYKKPKPFLVISPSDIEMDERSIFSSNMLNRYNFIDPKDDLYGAKALYSIPIIQSNKCSIVYRRNRFVYSFETLIMEPTIARQTNTFNMMVMNLRHNSKFTINRVVEHAIPIAYIKTLANIYELDYLSDFFLEEINRAAMYPIVKRYAANEVWKFYMQYEISIHVEVPGFPSKDTPEMSKAIEHGARIQDRFQFTVDLPTEFLLLVKSKYKNNIEVNLESDTVISPVNFVDLDWPCRVDSFEICNKVNVEFDEKDEAKVNVIQFLVIHDDELAKEVDKYIKAEKLSANDILRCVVYPNGSYIALYSILHDNGDLEITSPMYDVLCTICMYLDLSAFNQLRLDENKEMIGDIEKY